MSVDGDDGEDTVFGAFGKRVYCEEDQRMSESKMGKAQFAGRPSVPASTWRPDLGRRGPPIIDSAPPDFKKVEGAEKWKPVIGEGLRGHYAGKHERIGQHGQYTEYYVRAHGRLYFITGISAQRLFENAQIVIGSEIYLICLDAQTTTEGHAQYDFSLYVK